jgi:hypothetical protein
VSPESLLSRALTLPLTMCMMPANRFELDTVTGHLLHDAVRLVTCESPNGMHWSDDVIDFCQEVFNRAGGGNYEHMRGPGQRGLQHAAGEEGKQQLRAASLKDYNVPLPSLRTVQRSQQDAGGDGEDELAGVGVNEDLARAVVQAATKAQRSLVILHDEKSISAGLETVNGRRWGETNYGGNRVDGKPDLRDRRNAVDQYQTTIEPLCVQLQMLQSSALREMIDWQRLTENLTSVLARLKGLQKQVRGVARELGAKKAAKARRVMYRVRKKQREEARKAEEEGRDAREVDAIAHTSPQERAWDARKVDADDALAHLAAWRPLLKELAKDLGACAPGDAAAATAAAAKAALKWQTLRHPHEPAGEDDEKKNGGDADAAAAAPEEEAALEGDELMKGEQSRLPACIAAKCTTHRLLLVARARARPA